MKHAELVTLLREYVEQFIAAGAKTLLLRDNFMNDYDGEDFTDADVRAALEPIVANAKLGDGFCIDILRSMDELARDEHKSTKRACPNIKPTTSDALMACFIKHIAIAHWTIDYPVWTKDLDKKPKKRR